MKTDWDSYYNKPYKTTTYSRAITQKNLLKLMSRYKNKEFIHIAEFGGANSCFFDAIQKTIKPSHYSIIDNNELGLKKFIERKSQNNSVSIHHADVLDLNIQNQFDLTFSVGLIEHFCEKDTATIIEKHFEATKPGGTIVITFPTPTFLYKATRYLAEKMNLWIFHDERPLMPNEVIATCNKKGSVLFRKTIWPIFLTQHVIVVKKL